MNIVKNSLDSAAKAIRVFFVSLARAVTNPVPCWEDYLRQTR